MSVVMQQMQQPIQEPMQPTHVHPYWFSWAWYEGKNGYALVGVKKLKVPHEGCARCMINSLTHPGPPCEQQSTFHIKLSSSGCEYYVSEQCAKRYYIDKPSDLSQMSAIFQFVSQQP